MKIHKLTYPDGSICYCLKSLPTMGPVISMSLTIKDTTFSVAEGSSSLEEAENSELVQIPDDLAAKAQSFLQAQTELSEAVSKLQKGSGKIIPALSSVAAQQTSAKKPQIAPIKMIVIGIDVEDSRERDSCMNIVQATKGNPHATNTGRAIEMSLKKGEITNFVVGQAKKQQLEQENTDNLETVYLYPVEIKIAEGVEPATVIQKVTAFCKEYRRGFDLTDGALKLLWHNKKSNQR